MLTPLYRTTVAAVAFAAFMTSAIASELGRPTTDVLLTVTGAIAVTNAEDAAVFDLPMLEAMPPVTFQTTTIWTEGLQTFTGVPLKTLIDTLGVQTGTLRATAVNDYTVEIPVDTAIEGGPIIAYVRNDAAMSLRDKGPLWIIYPYDGNPDYQSEVVYSRSIWQLDRIEVVK
ncbi:oxidoreductase [Pseudogemmobacter sp. W21_MBD1_M6]|uniref:oxidoreductase n=1 Tax=Pseudogemmobacter sp. W21_MBD1_M6 TaxID=3240271 RepID=UPI003F9E0730